MTNNIERVLDYLANFNEIKKNAVSVIEYDLDKLMRGNDIVFDEPIMIKSYTIYGITYVSKTNNENLASLNVAFFVNSKNDKEEIANIPFEVVTAIYLIAMGNQQR